MTYNGFQRFDAANAYAKMRREQREDDKRHAEFDREVEKQMERDMERQQEVDIENVVSDDSD